MRSRFLMDEPSERSEEMYQGEWSPSPGRASSRTGRSHSVARRATKKDGKDEDRLGGFDEINRLHTLFYPLRDTPASPGDLKNCARPHGFFGVSCCGWTAGWHRRMDRRMDCLLTRKPSLPFFFPFACP